MPLGSTLRPSGSALGTEAGLRSAWAEGGGLPWPLFPFGTGQREHQEEPGKRETERYSWGVSSPSSFLGDHNRLAVLLSSGAQPVPSLSRCWPWGTAPSLQFTDVGTVP